MRTDLVVAVDAPSVIHRDWHTAHGREVDRLFVRKMDYLWRELKPWRVVAAFDRHNFRKAIFDDYKATRTVEPGARDAVRAAEDALFQPHKRGEFPTAIVHMEGYEADDCVATLATAARRAGLRCLVVTSDKDAHQLLDDEKCLIAKSISIAGGKLTLDYFTANKLRKTVGIEPRQCVDYQSLVGDTSDNIPGAKGIGPKTARRLLQEYDTLEWLLQNVERCDVTVSQRQGLRDVRPRVAWLRNMFTLRTDVKHVADAL